MTFNRRVFVATVVLALSSWGGSAAAAGTKSVAYYSAYPAYLDAYLIDWQGSTSARVVNLVGSADGSVTTTGSQRVITLSTPISQQYYSADIDPCTGDQVLLQQDTLQVAVNSLSGTDNRGTSSVVELGTITPLAGCDVGQSTPFGSLSDPGFKTNHLSLALRPSVSDLVAGARIAGMSEEAPDDSAQFGADIVSFQAGGTVQFGATGHTYPGAFDANQWLQLALPSGPRAYTRIAVDRRTGAERWLFADWAGGRPSTVRAVLMVKPLAGATFGSVKQASRMWQSGLGSSDLNTFYYYLYQDATGERVLVDLSTGEQTRTPVNSWVFDGNNIVTKRGRSSQYTRTWVPLANGAGRTRFVMESELFQTTSGTFVNIKPRVNVYTDTGAATPPAPPVGVR